MQIVTFILSRAGPGHKHALILQEYVKFNFYPSESGDNPLEEIAGNIADEHWTAFFGDTMDTSSTSLILISKSNFSKV